MGSICSCFNVHDDANSNNCSCWNRFHSMQYNAVFSGNNSRHNHQIVNVDENNNNVAPNNVDHGNDDGGDDGDGGDGGASTIENHFSGKLKIDDFNDKNNNNDNNDNNCCSSKKEFSFLDTIFEYQFPSSEDEDVCPTCLEEYTDENPRIMTKCCHHYHLSCIFEWQERSATCPVCGVVMEFEETS